MKKTTLIRILVSLALWAPVLATSTTTNADIVKMHEAGIDEATILLAIDANSPRYTTSVDALIALKAAGLSEAVIQAMIVRSYATPSDDESSVPAGFFAQDFPSIAPAQVSPEKGGTYYLRSGLHFEGGTSMGTNYARGVLVPINTAVRVRAIKKKKLLIEVVADGRKLEIKNVSDYTMKTMPKLVRLLLSKEPTPLDRLPVELAQAIREGVMRKGMTKEQVLMARGYPPAHRTPSINEQRWTYWTSRFGQQIVFFDKNERLAEGDDIY